MMAVGYGRGGMFSGKSLSNAMSQMSGSPYSNPRLIILKDGASVNQPWSSCWQSPNEQDEYPSVKKPAKWLAPFLPCEYAMRSWQFVTWKRAMDQTMKAPTRLAPDFGLPAFYAVRNEGLLYEPQSLR